jgi:hypothetical protein
VPVRAPSARLVALAWDVTALVAGARRGDDTLPAPPAARARLLVALSPDGRVTTARCGEPLERLLEALDGTRTPAAAAARAGLAAAEAGPVLRQLTEIGAVEWHPASSRGAPGVPPAPRPDGC